MTQIGVLVRNFLMAAGFCLMSGFALWPKTPASSLDLSLPDHQRLTEQGQRLTLQFEKPFSIAITDTSAHPSHQRGARNDVFVFSDGRRLSEAVLRASRMQPGSVICRLRTDGTQADTAETIALTGRWVVNDVIYAYEDVTPRLARVHVRIPVEVHDFAFERAHVRELELMQTYVRTEGAPQLSSTDVSRCLGANLTFARVPERALSTLPLLVTLR